MKKKLILLIPLLVLCSLFAAVSADEGDIIKFDFKMPSAEIEDITTIYNGSIGGTDVTFELTYENLGSDTWKLNAEWTDFGGSEAGDSWWDVDINTRVISNPGSNFGNTLYAGTHDFMWIYTSDIAVGDDIALSAPGWNFDWDYEVVGTEEITILEGEIDGGATFECWKLIHEESGSVYYFEKYSGIGVKTRVYISEEWWEWELYEIDGFDVQGALDTLEDLGIPGYQSFLVITGSVILIHAIYVNKKAK